VCLASIQKISTAAGVAVRALTSVDDELFVLLKRDDNQVAIYSIDDYKFRRHLNLPGVNSECITDMTSCVHQNCLYMSDSFNNCIPRYHLAGVAINKWQVPDKPCYLSVTSICNLLVTCQGEPNKLVELSADSGQCVREIKLPSEISAPYHSLELATDKFVVCHGCHRDGNLNQVCVVGVVGEDGKVTRSYGGHWGSEVGRLDLPCYLAVDKDSQFIFVADYLNDRVVLLSPTLEFVRHISEGLSRPTRLYFHLSTRRLFVGQPGGGVFVIQL